MVKENKLFSFFHMPTDFNWTSLQVTATSLC